MGLIINIDQALEQRTAYNVLREPLNDLLKERQEAWEKQNPIDLIFNRSTLSSFQETYSSNIGFDHAFAETGDYAVAPIFNTAEGFQATYRSRTFQGGFIITQQVLEDGQTGVVKDNANAFMKRWHGDLVEYALTAISAGFGVVKEWGDASTGISRLKLTSADTVDGELDGVKNPLFTNSHTIVKRPGMTASQINAAKQSNLFYANINVHGDSSTGELDPDMLPKMADAINQVITIMENYKDDNGKYAGVDGAKTIVAANDARLKSALSTVLSMDQFKYGQSMYLNPAFQRATAGYTPYLNDIEMFADGVGVLIIDKAYNAANHGPEFTERIPLTLNVADTKNPYGVSYDARQRFDINAASWRGIAYLHFGIPAGSSGDWDYINNFTEIETSDLVATPVKVLGTVVTEAST